jgi:PAS domain S-box-containing protein
LTSAEELARQNDILRDRIARLEGEVTGQLDPVLRSLLENAPAFLNVVTPDGRFLATGRVSEAFGSVIGRTVFEFMDPSQHATAREAFERARTTARPTTYESIGLAENGEPNHTYMVRAVPLIEKGEVTALVLVPTDITERVRLERSVIESEQGMRLAVDAARMGLWRWDIPRNDVTWDARMLEIFGQTAAPRSFETYLEVVHPDHRALVHRTVLQARTTGVYPTFEHRLVVKPGGGERWILAAGTVLKGDNGQAEVMLGGALDITEQKAMATQLQRAERVEALGHLTAGIAHNFNNLLAVILPNVEFALLEAPDRVRESLCAALDASLQARDLIKSLMSLTRQRATKSDEPSDPKDVAARLIEICRLTFPKEIDLVTNIDASVGLVDMPAGEIEQVLLNLLLNARDAVMEVPEGRRQIQLLVDRVAAAPEGGQVRIRIVDTGVGMTEVVREQIFAPFFTTKPPHRASGLGLANALSRVHERRGRLECQTAPGLGTTFTLLLPESTAVARPSEEPSTRIATGAGGQTILLVDDEPTVRAVIGRLLKSQRYEILEAGSAGDARAKLRQYGSRVDLILLDQSMPSESGLEALPSLRALCPAPVVLFTGLATDLPAGISALLEKPARPAELLHVVRDVLAHHGQ